MMSVLLVFLTVLGCARTETNAPPASAQNGQNGQKEVNTRYDMPPHHFIRRGMRVEQVESLVGVPEEKQRMRGRPDVWQYSFGIVMVEEGRVRYKYPPSGMEEKKKMEPLENTR